MLIPALVLIRFYDFSMRLRGMKRDADIKQSYARRHEIERELRMKVPSLSEFDAGKIAAAIDKHENFDRPQSLRVTAGVLDTKLTLHTLQQGGTKKVVQKYPRSNMLEKALKEIIREQQETLFPLRKEINIAYRKFFIGFPSISGRPCSVPTLGKELETLSPEKRVELQKQLLEDFRRRFIGFEQYLRKRKRDVQQVLKKEWMPLELRRAFVAFDMLCMKSEWFTPFYRLAGSHDGRMRAGAWLRRDPELRSPAVHIAEEVDLQFMLRVQRALPWQLRKLLPQTSEASET